MGTIFEELIRKFNEALDENPGEHFTPRDVVHLMVDLMLAGDETRLRAEGVVLSVYDPCCGSGGMLMIAKEHITVGVRRNGELLRPAINPGADIHLFGQEVNPETFAICKSDLFIKEPTAATPRTSPSAARSRTTATPASTFDYLIANPPYGKDWKRDQEAVPPSTSGARPAASRPGLPRISDGQLLFLQHMLAHMKKPKDGGSRVAIIMNGSPLFTGDAGSGESEIRRWVLENDWLEALIALPEQLFYNTGIATYVWVSPTARPGAQGQGPADRRHVLLGADAQEPRRQAPGDPAGEGRGDRQTADGVPGGRARPGSSRRPTSGSARSPSSGRSGSTSRRPPSVSRGWRRRGRSRRSPSKKKGAAGAKEQAEGRVQQEAIRKLLGTLPATLYKDREEFERLLKAAAEKAGIKLAAPVLKAILSALSERDETAAICRDGDGHPSPTPSCATPRACRSPRASRRTSNVR